MATSKITIGVIGAGEMGSALIKAFKQAGRATVRSWDKDARKCAINEDCTDVVSSSQILLFCVPSWAIREAAEQIKPTLRAETFIITVAKGIEQQTNVTMAQVLEQEFSQQSTGLLYGPMLAEEIEMGHPAVGVVATRDRDQFDQLLPLLAGSNLSVTYSDDPHGVALAGVLKNIYAIGLGIADGLALGHNFRGWYIQAAQGEMADIIERLGGRRETAYSLAGIGDLITTGASTHSKNFSFGRDLAVRGRSAIKSEGFVSLPALTQLLAGQAEHYPIMTGIRRVVVEHASAAEVIPTLPQQTS